MLKSQPSNTDQARQPVPPNTHLEDQIAPYGPKLRFLDLPAEIRNQIYTYVFTLDDGVRVSSNLKLCLVNTQLGAIGSGNAVLVEANALKYTCHQLHLETKSLLLRYTTTLIFKSSSDDEDGLKTFLAFALALKSDTPIRRMIRIHPRYHYPANDPVRALMSLAKTGDFNDLAFFCQLNPSITVILHYPAPKLCLERIGLEVHRLRLTMRIFHRHSIAVAPGSLDWQIRQCRDERSLQPRTRLTVPLNLRVTLDWEDPEEMNLE